MARRWRWITCFTFHARRNLLDAFASGNFSLRHNLKNLLPYRGSLSAMRANVYHRKHKFRRVFSDYVRFPRETPQVPVNEEPGSSRIRASPVRNAFGGQVMGSTARLRRCTLGSGSPLKSIK